MSRARSLGGGGVTWHRAMEDKVRTKRFREDPHAQAFCIGKKAKINLKTCMVLLGVAGCAPLSSPPADEELRRQEGAVPADGGAFNVYIYIRWRASQG